MNRSTACLFLLGTVLCSIPARTGELPPDMECQGIVRRADYYQMMSEGNGRERQYAIRARVPAMPGVKPAAAVKPLSPRERAELRQAAERFVRENSVAFVDLRKP